MTITYQLTKQLRQILWANDCLGFDNCSLAAEAIITHDDFSERWEFVNADDLAAVNAWRAIQFTHPSNR